MSYTKSVRFLMASIGLAVVALIVLAAGIIAQSNPDWSQSSVAPSPISVRAGERVTFTVQVVNSSTITAENAFVYNPVPAGTGYVTVSNGFPIVGGGAGAAVEEQAFDVPDVSVPTGDAYDVSLGSVVDGATVEPDDVTAVGWVGDVEPGIGNAVSMDLVLDVASSANSVVTDTAYIYHAGTMTAVTGTVGTAAATDAVTTVLYLPLVTTPEIQTVSITQTVESNWLLIASGQSLEDALDGSDVEAYRQDGWLDVMNSGPGDYWMGEPNGKYYIARDLIAFDLSSAPQGRIVTATLEMSNWGAERKQQFRIKFHQGDWSMPPDSSSWDAYGELLAAYNYSDTFNRPKSYIPLPGLVGVQTPSVLRMTVRGDEVTEMTSDYRGVSFMLEDWEEGYPTAFLHLKIQLR